MSTTTVLTTKEKSMLFWASFLALFACGIGFGIRVMNINTWIGEFNIDGGAAGAIFGASLWPIAVGMILFSLIIDKIGYRVAMLVAAVGLILATVLTFFAASAQSLKVSFLIAGFCHGIVECCINPLAATMFKDQKSKMLNILHASWPAGIVIGAGLCLLLGGDGGLGYRTLFLALIIPAAIFGFVFLTTKHFPQDERVENNVSYMEMMKEFGGLSFFLAATFLFYEFTAQLGLFGEGQYTRILASLSVGAVIGLIAGFVFKSTGKVLFFILCLIMIPLATAEIATDGWIQKLMQPVLAADYNIDSGWAIVLSSLIMMTLRFFAGVPLKFLSPPALLFASSIFSIVGLFLLSGASGGMIFLAFILYGIGQTFYWPTVLGLTAEQFPKGGAMTLNTVSAMGLLTVGIFGMPFLGSVGDNFNSQIVKQEAPALYEKQEGGEHVYAEKDKSFFGWNFDSVKADALTMDDSLLTAKGRELKVATIAPENPTREDRVKALEAQGAFNSAKAEEVRTPEGVALVENIQNNGRKVLKVAAVLPGIMAVAFLLMMGYFKAKGGYRPVDLSAGGGH